MHQEEQRSKEANRSEFNPPKNVASSGAANAHQSQIAARSEQRVMVGPTGPRTTAGKQRTSRNAEKHGFSSKKIGTDETLLKQYNAFLKDLRKRSKPVGGIEESLVQTLAFLFVRHDRVIVAEIAQSELDANYAEWDQQFKDVEALRQATMLERKGESSEGFYTGLLYRTENPAIRDRCLEYVAGIEAELSKDVFDLDMLSMLHAGLFGGYASGHMSYLVKLRQGENAIPSIKKEVLLEHVSQIRARLLSGRERQKEIETGRAELRRSSKLVPDSPNLERFIRYEANSSRELDRALNRLERLQRMRLGLPSLPTVKVEVT
jgi:hypothetical protein